MGGELVDEVVTTGVLVAFACPSGGLVQGTHDCSLEEQPWNPKNAVVNCEREAPLHQNC